MAINHKVVTHSLTEETLNLIDSLSIKFKLNKSELVAKAVRELNKSLLKEDKDLKEKVNLIGERLKKIICSELYSELNNS
jgi:hypothetical protein